LTFRNANLNPGAKLELVIRSSSPSVVSVKVEWKTDAPTPSSTELTGLPTSMTLWQTLRQAEDKEKAKQVNLTARATPRLNNRPLAGLAGGQLYWESPVVNIMMKEYASLPDLQKTLSQCGIDGAITRRVLLRVEFRGSETPLHEAMAAISEYVKDTEEPKPEATAPPVTVKPEAGASTEQTARATLVIPAVPTDAPVAPSEEKKTEAARVEAAPEDLMDIDSQPSAGPASSTSKATDTLRPTQVFTAPTSSTPAAALTQDDDSIFEPSIAHAKLRQMQLQQRSQNMRLKSDEELAKIAAEQASKLAEVKTVTIRVRFPDSWSAQWPCGQAQTGAFLHSAVRSVMRHPNQPFKLVVPGVNTAIEDSDRQTLIAGNKFKGNVLVNLIWEQGTSDAAKKEPFLTQEWVGLAKKIVVPELPKTEEEVEGDLAPRRTQQTAKPQASDETSVGKKISKLFPGLGKKK
jgi:tether containing UBX domain for GLUT4